MEKSGGGSRLCIEFDKERKMFTTSKQIPKIWKLTILIFSLMISVVACGGSEPPPPTLGPTPTPELPTPTPVPESPTVTPTPEPPPATPTPSAEDRIKQGIAYYDQDELEAALGELKKAIELEPDNADAHRNLGSVYVKQGKWQEAAAAYEQAIQLSPDFGEAYGDLVVPYINLNKLSEAIEAGEKAIALAPNYAIAYNNLGAAYKRQERFDEAVTMLQKAIRIDPEYAMPHYNLGLVHYTQGQADQAIAEWTESARLDPNYPDTHKNLGVIYLELDQAAEAIAEFETYLQLAPDAPDRAAVEDEIAKLTAQIAALSGEAVGQSSQSGAEQSLMSVDINRPPGHSIGFESSLEPDGTHRFLFLASPGDKVAAGITSSSKMLVGIQNASTGEIIGAVPNNDDSLVVPISQNALYHIVIEDAGEQGGDYVAAFEASPKVSFALDPTYFIIGRLPEGGLLYYTYTAPGGATLQGNAIPHPDTPIDLVVKIRELESKALLFEANESGPGENEQFSFTVPDEQQGDNKLLTYIVSVEDVDRNKGAYLLTVTSDVPIAVSAGTSPERVVQSIFDVAKSGNFASLEDLCDPVGENDADTQMICDLVTDDANREEFVQYFASGKINGDVKISPDGAQAEVPFLFGPDGDQEETMELVNRNGQWYLFGF
jgi:tetratricopeptide (TPR) repeat protein